MKVLTACKKDRPCERSPSKIKGGFGRRTDFESVVAPVKSPGPSTGAGAAGVGAGWLLFRTVFARVWTSSSIRRMRSSKSAGTPDMSRVRKGGLRRGEEGRSTEVGECE